MAFNKWPFFFFFGKRVDTCFKHPLWTVVLVLEIQQWVESSPYPCGRNLHHHHYYYYCKSGLGCCVQRKGVRYVSGDGPYFYFTWKVGCGFSSFLLYRSKQNPEDLCCYDQSLGLSLWAFPTVLVWDLWVQAACSQTTVWVELPVCLGGFPDCLCESGNCYWCSPTVYYCGSNCD